jgi:hypothetical protein
MCATERLCHTRKGGQTAQICATQGEVDKQHKCVPQKGCAIQGEVDEQHEVPIRTSSRLRFEPGNSVTHSQRATATASSNSDRNN